MMRGPGDFLFASPPTPGGRSLRDRILYPTSVLGPGRLNFVLDKVPFGLHHMPERVRLRVTRNHLGPWGPWWLAHRFEGKVPVIPFSQIIGARAKGEKLELRVRDTTNGTVSERLVDHLVAGTGYQPDVDRIPFIDRDLAAQVDRIDRGPRVSANCETSVSGLYFVGPSTMLSFGPLFRFVAGAEHSSRAVARHVASQRPPTLAPSWYASPPAKPRAREANGARVAREAE
jgi:hypothetical protein